MQEHYTSPHPAEVATQATDSTPSGPSSPPRPRRRQPTRPSPENIYDRRTGEWAGQLPATELAVEAQPKHPRPKPDKTLKSLVDWVYNLHLKPTPFAVIMAIVRHVDWATGRSCYASRETLARRAGVSIGTLRRQLTYLKNANIIDRRQRLTGSAETWLVLDSPAHQAELPLQPERDTRTSVMKVTGDPLEKVTGDPLEKVTGDPPASSVITNHRITNLFNQSVTDIDETHKSTDETHRSTDETHRSIDISVNQSRDKNLENEPEWFRVLAKAFPQADPSLFNYKVLEQGWSEPTLYSAARLTAERCKTLAGLAEYFFRACNSESHRGPECQGPAPSSYPLEPRSTQGGTGKVPAGL